MRRTWRALGAAAVLVGGSGVGVSGPVSAQVAPTLEVAPLRVDPEQMVTFTVRDCPTAPELHVGESDFIRLIEPTATAVAGTWSTEFEAGLTDWTVNGTCGDVPFDEVIVDIDHPLMSFLPIGAYAPEPDRPSTVYGSDCPDGTTASVTFEATGPAGVESGPVEAEIDDRGDWQVAVPPIVVPVSGSAPGGDRAQITVRGSCGSVTYAPLTFEVASGPPVVTRPPTTEVEVPAPSPPARPVPGHPAFTG